MEVVPKNVHWLIPEESTPCDIFLFFRGKYVAALSAGQAVSFNLLEKLVKTGSSQFYIRQSDCLTWGKWTAQRCPLPSQTASKDSRDHGATEKQLYGNKRAELLSYVQKSLVKKTLNSAPLDQAFSQALESLQNVARLPTLDWYFKQFHEPPDLLNHNSRVAYSLAVFCRLHDIALAKELEGVIFSALIHELDGDPTESLKRIVSQDTLSTLEKLRHPVPKEVIELIRFHDELCSGKGFPDNRKRAEIPVPIRVFSLFNHFDHYRLKSTGTRRARLDRTKELMTARRADYDPDFWDSFWDFWESQVEAIN